MKLYEEQELTMQIFSEPESGSSADRRGSNISLVMGDLSQDNMYATIQHSSNTISSSIPNYTTIPGQQHNVYESAVSMGFQGSTFQPTAVSQLTLDNDTQSQFF